MVVKLPLLPSPGYSGDVVPITWLLYPQEDSWFRPLRSFMGGSLLLSILKQTLQLPYLSTGMQLRVAAAP